MRTVNTVRNISASVLLGLIVTVFSFTIQRSIALYLGPEFLGLTSLLTTVVGMLAVAELGFGSAIVFHLYEPMKHNNWQRVSLLMYFYRKVYRAIAMVVLIAGLAILPFMGLVTSDTHLDVNVYVAYAIFLTSTVLSYFISYKRAILQADQRSYIIDITYTSIYVVIAIIQVLILVLYQNYYLFLICSTALPLISNSIISLVVRKKYKKLGVSIPSRLDADTRAHIFKQIKGLIFHKSSGFIVPASTNVIISTMLGIKYVGLASNYILISTTITTMTWKVSTAMTASIGNLLVDASPQKLYKVYRRLQFFAYSLATIITSIFISTASSFVSGWVGTEYILDALIVIPIALTLYLTITRLVPNSVKQAAGIFYEDRYVPIIELVICIVSGILLTAILGLGGVFWGLAIGSLFIHIYSYPKFVYAGVLGRPRYGYCIDVAGYVVVAIIVAIVTSLLCNIVDTGVDYMDLLIKITTGLLTFSLLWLAIFGRSSEATYFKELLLKRLYRRAGQSS